MIKNKKRWLKKFMPLALACAGLLGYQPSTFAANNVSPDRPSDNQVTVTEDDGSIEVVYGGGSEDESEDVTNNHVNINGGNVRGVLGGVGAGGDVFNNTVEITGGNIQGVSGGIAVVNNELKNASGNVTGNRVIIHGGTIQFVSGGEVTSTFAVDGSNALSDDDILILGRGTVSDNVVEIDGGSINGQVIGGSALSGDAVGNNITIGGGTIIGSIIGGISDSGDVRDNIVEIRGMPDLADAYLYGGLTSSGSASGNTLRVKTLDITARQIDGFQNINFDLPEETRNGSTVLTLTEGSTKLGGTHMSVYVDGNAPISTGDTMNLIVNRNGIDVNGAMSTSFDVDDGTKALGDMTYDGVMYRGAVGYDLELTNSGDTFTANVGEQVVPPIPIVPPIPLPEPNPLPEDEKTEFDETQVEDVEMVRENVGYELFFSNGYGHLKTKLGNGSYVKSNSGSHDLGIARHFRRDSSILTLAPVFTYSYGNYDAHLRSGSEGSGNQQYAAGGVIVRNLNNSGFYYEGSLRAGRSHTKYVTNDFPIPTQPHMSYTTNADVILGHLRLGNQWRLGRDHILDVYGYYAYARQGSSSTDLNLGNHVSFSSSDSGRFRTGYRLTSRLSRISQLYTGLAYQYDTNSDSISRVEGHSTNNIKGGDSVTFGKDGSSGMLEIGWLIRPLRDNPWTLDLHATGWVGMQEGVTAMAKVKKAF